MAGSCCCVAKDAVKERTAESSHMGDTEGELFSPPHHPYVLQLCRAAFERSARMAASISLRLSRSLWDSCDLMFNMAMSPATKASKWPMGSPLILTV